MITRQIHNEIINNGLANEAHRHDCAQRNADFYEGNFAAYLTRPNTTYEGSRYSRESLIMQKIVDTLSQDLYTVGPTRTLPDDPQADEWLASVYKNNDVDGWFQAADAWSCVSDVCALFVEALDGEYEDPSEAIKISLWPAHQFYVWCDRDNPLEPVAVGLYDVWDATRRLRVWTADELLTYMTEKLGADQTTGGTAYHLVASEVNPYGVIPISFVHFKKPTVNFWSGGPGENLMKLNDYTSYYLTEIGDSLRYCGKPIIKMFGVLDGWSPEYPIRPGAIWRPPAAAADAAGNGIPPDVGYLQPDVSFVDAGWLDLNNFIDHSLEMYGIPKAAIRLEQSATKSGVAIVSEQIPILKWAKSRQRPFACYERSLARVVLRVGAAYYRNNGVGTAAQLQQAAERLQLNLKWSNLFADMVDEQRDAQDQRRLQQGLTSRVQLLMRDQSLSEEEARAALEKIAELRDWESKLLGPIPVAVPVVPTAEDPGTVADSESLDA